MPLSKNSEDMIKMQLEAERRLKERQKNTEKISRDSAQKENSEKQVNTNNDKNTKIKENPPINSDALQQTNKSGGINDIFNSLMKDSDKTLILILILILSDEEVDTGLILALMYLII